MLGRLRQLYKNRHQLLPLVRMAERYYEEADVWVHAELDTHHARIGSRFEFWHYLRGKSQVEVASLEELLGWLLACSYADDMALFQERDFWQHPSTFEQLRRGDCEDHALWAWRKLGELGIPARFYTGRQHGEDGGTGFHAWVVLQLEGEEWLLEATSKDRDKMLLRLSEARDRYAPHYSVGHMRDARIYGGFLQYRDQRKRRRRKQNGRPEVPPDRAAPPAGNTGV